MKGTAKRGKRFTLHCRTAWDGNAILVDKGADDWACYRITPQKWEVYTPPIPPFRRYPATAAFNEPIKPDGDDLFTLTDFMPTRNANAKILLTAWLVSTWVPGLPRPAIVFHGEHGAGKSWASTVCRQIVDPSTTPIQSLPDNLADLNLHLDHAMLPCFDNLGNLPQWASDHLCRAVTGTSLSARQLYTDSDEVLYSYTRTFILNGIDLIVKRPDLLDRSLVIPLQRFSDSERLPQSELDAAWESRKGKILHAMLDSLAGAMDLFPTIRCPEPIRLADWHRWMVAIGVNLGVEPDMMDEIIRANTSVQHDEAIESSPVAQCIIEILTEHEKWRGTAHSLFREIERQAESLGLMKAVGMPKSPIGLSRRIKEIAPALRAIGIVAQKHVGTRNSRYWTVERI